MQMPVPLPVMLMFMLMFMLMLIPIPPVPHARNSAMQMPVHASPPSPVIRSEKMMSKLLHVPVEMLHQPHAAL